MLKIYGRSSGFISDQPFSSSLFTLSTVNFSGSNVEFTSAVRLVSSGAVIPTPWARSGNR